MPNFKSNVRFESDFFTHQYSGLTAEELSTKIGQTLQADGYKIKEGTPMDATWEKGNRVMRILFGAFVKYSKMNVKIDDHDAGTLATVTKNSSGMSGGVIGVNQVKKEFQRIAQVLQTV